MQHDHQWEALLLYEATMSRVHLGFSQAQCVIRLASAFERKENEA